MKIQGVSALEYLLQVERLKTTFYTEDGAIPAVDGISFRLRPGEVVGIVGESGCGKSVAVLSLMRLIPHPPGAVSADSILFDGQELSALSENEMRRIRGNDMAMIFQEPMSSLNPVFTIGNQLSEAIRLHQRLKGKEARAKSVEMLKTVGIPRAEKVYDEYPHSLSGGMRQRAMIAMALSCRPKLLIADEPTTALDVTIQAQILKLMTDLKHSFNTAIIFITHDLGVIAEMAQHVIVMYAGKIVEDTDVFTLFHKPRHPYTIGLINSKPKIEEEVEKLRSIPELVPNPLNMPAGCSYHPRCAEADDLCRVEAPAEIEIKPGHRVRCWLYAGRKGVSSP